MKQRIFSIILLSAMLISMAAPAQARTPAPGGAPQALLWVALPDEQALQRFETTGLPAYTTLLDGKDDSYLLSGADALGQQALADAGLDFRILDADLRGASYYLASPAPGQAAPQWASFGRLLLDDGALVLLRMDARSAEALALAGGDLQALSLTPKPLYPAQSESVFPTVITPDPVIASILDQVTHSMVYSDTADISGERPVMIGGETYTILTRHTSSGTPIQKATQFVGEQLAALGLDVEYHSWTANGYTNRNVIGEITGLTNPEDIYIIGGHLDDLPPSGRAPGADDNASGSVATLIAARLLSQYQWGCTLRFAFWTGEEQGLLGSAAYAQRAYNMGENILGYLNLDMIAWNTGGSDPGIDLIYRSDRPATKDLAELFEDVIDAYDLNLIPELRSSTAGNSDHSSFWNYGYTAMMGIEDFADFNTHYHQITDDMDNFQDWAYYEAFVKASLGTFAHMSNCMISCEPVDQVNFTWLPETPLTSEEIVFTATATGTLPITYTWDFGDGSPFAVGITATHTYTISGAYTATLTADNPCGQQIVQQIITVTSPSHCDPVAQAGFTWLPEVPLTGEEIVFTATATGTLPITYTWDFGDGSPLAVGITATHTFVASGVYTVTLTVSNICGQQVVQHAIGVAPLWKIYLPTTIHFGSDEAPGMP